MFGYTLGILLIIMIVEVLCTLPKSEDKDELVHWVTIASKRSNKLSKLLRKVGIK